MGSSRVARGSRSRISPKPFKQPLRGNFQTRQMPSRSGAIRHAIAACELPGAGFRKGVEAVSRAARAIPDLGFDNPITFGRNRPYRPREQ